MSCTGPVTGGTVPRTEAAGNAYSQLQEEQCLAMGSYHGELWPVLGQFRGQFQGNIILY
jgi:hypothetical protein